jgi:hypothetical protein
MKNFLAFAGVICFAVTHYSSLLAQTAAVLSRPLYVDTASATSRGALLVRLSGYPVDQVRYRLFKGSSQYQCWDQLNNCFITSTSYASGPLAAGSPSLSTTFWITYQRGSNNSSAATYRDRLGPEFKENFRDVALPAATGILNPFTLSGTLLPGDDLPLTSKYIILLFRGTDLIAATHSDTVTGTFSAVFPAGTTIDKMEVRTVLNDTVFQVSGAWSATTDLGNVRLGAITGIENPYSLKSESGVVNIFPVPAIDFITISASVEPDRVEIIDLSGKVVLTYLNSGETSFNISLSGSAPGIYFVRVSISKKIFIKKIIKL